MLPWSLRRIGLYVGLVSVLIFLAALAILVSARPPRTAITRDNAMRIKKLMTEAEVEEILGDSEGEESVAEFRRVAATPEHQAFRSRIMAWRGRRDRRVGDTLSMRSWHSNEAHVDVVFDQNGRVVDSVVILRVSGSFVEFVRSWLR